MKVLGKLVDTATSPWTTFRVDAEGSRPGQLIATIKQALPDGILIDSGVEGRIIFFSVTEVQEAINRLGDSGRPELAWLAGELDKM